MQPAETLNGAMLPDASLRNAWFKGAQAKDAAFTRAALTDALLAAMSEASQQHALKALRRRGVDVERWRPRGGADP